MAVCTHLDQITVDLPEDVEGCEDWTYCFVDDAGFVLTTEGRPGAGLTGPAVQVASLDRRQVVRRIAKRARLEWRPSTRRGFP